LIENSPVDGVFAIINKRDKLVWWKTIAFECGISPTQFRKCRISDIEEIMTIKSIVSQKGKRNQKVQDMMNQVRFK